MRRPARVEFWTVVLLLAMAVVVLLLVWPLSRIFVASFGCSLSAQLRKSS